WVCLTHCQGAERKGAQKARAHPGAGTNPERARSLGMSDPKSSDPKSPDPKSNTEKDPDDWVAGDEPMTGAQASYLKTLSEQAHDPGAYQDGLTKAEASKRIDALKARLAL